jgi:hypothetical protein
MVERLEMPEGSIGFRVSGKITRDEYFEFLPPVKQAIAEGKPLNLLIATADDFAGLDLGALWEDTKAAGSIGLGHHSSWRRIAVVTDKDWMRHAVSVFGWLSPGELRMFEPAELDAAKSWVAAR